MEFPTYDQVVKHELPGNKTLEVLRRMFSDTEEPEAKKKKKVCLMKGKFQPFHNGHYSIADDASKQTGMNVFLVIVNKKIPKSGNLPEELHKLILDDVVKDHPSIKGYVFSNGRSMRELMKSLPEGLEAGAFAGSPDECEDIKKQMGDEFLTVPMTKHISSKSVFQKIKEEDYEAYKKLVPKALHNYFYKIRNEISEL
jgi:citrate lyase synthetase